MDETLSYNSIENVFVSRSVERINGDHPFAGTKWLEKQGEHVIVGTVYVKYNGKSAVVHIPSGVKTVNRFAILFKSHVRKVIIPETVTTLCDYAFGGRGTEGVQEFVFTDSITRIGAYAFGNMNKWLEKFGKKPIVINKQLYQYPIEGNTAVISEGVVRICSEAFKKRNDLQSVVLPDSLKELGNEVFAECENLTVIKLPEGMEHIGERCFSRCKKLKKIALPDSLIGIGQRAFNGCDALEEVVLGNRVERIGVGAFAGCKGLKRFVMNNNVKSIPRQMFDECDSLQSITLSDSAEEIDRDAFRKCGSLTAVLLPGGLKRIKNEAFYGCRSLTQCILPDGLTEIGAGVFERCESITEMKLPTLVGDGAFSGCSSLKRVTFAEGMKKVNKACFNLCKSLEEIKLPDSVEVIGEEAFSGCESVRLLALPSKLKSIGAKAFYGCSGIESVVIPETVTTIGDSAFMNCKTLGQVQMPDQTAQMGIDVFTNTPYLKQTFNDFMILGGALTKYLGSNKDVVIPENVATITKNAFAESYHVETMIIANGVKTIGEQIMGVVQNWGNHPKPKLRKLVFEDSVESIGDNAFCDCEELEEIVFGKGLVYIGQKAFANCKKLKQIDLSSTKVKEVGDEAFDNCKNVKMLLLPESVETIGRGAFNGARLRTFALPKSVKKVERSAFFGTDELIVYDVIDPKAADADKWQSDKWNGTVNSPLACAMLYLPRDYVEAQGNTNWRDNHITVLSSETNRIRYRIYCDSYERDDYRAMMFSAWGKNASFTFDKYDDYFMKTRSMAGRTEMAFCRIMYPEGLSAEHRANYEAYLERCLYIERSAKRTAALIAREDAIERLKLLDQFGAIDGHNMEWLREQFVTYNAKKCLAFLNERTVKE